MAGPIAIVTDSTADIPAPLAAERRIHVVPMHILWEGRDLRDRIDIDSEVFYTRLVKTRELPTTSQPSPVEFADAFQRARDETDAEAVIALTISSKLSGSYNAALEAIKLVDFPAFVVDTLTGSLAHGLAVLALADARDAGISPEKAADFARQAAARTKMIFALDTLEFLYRSGRISNLRRWIGTALRIKPILHVKDGGIALLEQAHTRRRMLCRLIEIFEQVVDPAKPLHMGVLHGNAIDDMQAFLAEITARWKPARLIQSTVCASIGVHTGPGSLGFAIFQ